jgi:isoquinoline 1-oxidoreductase beta subunit
MITAASISTPGYWTSLRLAGAQARRVLLDKRRPALGRAGERPHDRAEHWWCTRLPTGRSRTATWSSSPRSGAAAADQRSGPEEAFAVPADRAARTFRVPTYRRRPTALRSTVSTCGCRACSTRRCSRRRTTAPKAAQVNSDEVAKMAGVKRVLSLPFGVAVLADSVHAANKGRSALKVKWDGGGNPNAELRFREGAGGVRPQRQGSERQGDDRVREGRLPRRRSPARRRPWKPSTRRCTATTRRWSR